MPVLPIQSAPEESSESLLAFYQANRFNPVLIPLETRQQWELHVAKRHNLYQRHLAIPLALLRDQSIIEFGSNSGENALVLAALGANLTLVEPNQQVLPRLNALFEQYGLKNQIESLVNQDIDSFQSTQRYDVVIAEGFLYTLPNRDALVKKLAQLTVPGGLVIISFNDRYGCLLEITKQVLLTRLCQLSGVRDLHSAACLELARTLFAEDFGKLQASRSFEAWWKDTLVSGFVRSRYLWSFPEILPVIEQVNGEIYSCSPRWISADNYQWYKSVPDVSERHKALLNNWGRSLPYFLTGLPIVAESEASLPTELLTGVTQWLERLASFTQIADFSEEHLEHAAVSYPQPLYDYLSRIGNPKLITFNSDLKALYDGLLSKDADELVRSYHHSSLRDLWGSAYHYLCFTSGV